MLVSAAVADRRESLAQWAENQRAVARALGLTIEDWMNALDAAGKRRTGVYAASVGAAMARKLSLAVLEGFDAVALATNARTLIDPRPPRVSSPLLAEAIRRADELGARPGGASRLKKKSIERRDPLPTPMRETKPIGDSAAEGTPDAPGKRRKKRADEEDEE
jgi:hypothetical protein